MVVEQAVRREFCCNSSGGSSLWKNCGNASETFCFLCEPRHHRGVTASYDKSEPYARPPLSAACASELEYLPCQAVYLSIFMILFCLSSRAFSG
jgi:hypothetical protein